MNIEVKCLRCGPVARARHWSKAVTLGAIHEHKPVQIRAIFDREAWKRLHRDYKARAADGARSVLHPDSDGMTVLIPAEVRG